MQYVFPAVFTKEDAGYSVMFPDVDGCFTSGETLSEAMLMAQDALSLMLLVMEDGNQPISAPTELREITCDDNSFTTLIRADTAEYRKRYGKQAVKKTLSIPAWLNTAAEEKGLNFSALLQAALREALDLR